MTLTAPYPVRSMKLSNVQRRQYSGGWPPGKSACWLFLPLPPFQYTLNTIHWQKLIYTFYYTHIYICFCIHTYMGLGLASLTAWRGYFHIQSTRLQYSLHAFPFFTYNKHTYTQNIVSSHSHIRASLLLSTNMHRYNYPKTQRFILPQTNVNGDYLHALSN